jgi:Ca2+-binding EF-hand superfamily protein
LEVFRRFDTNGDGILQPKEVKSLLQTLDAAKWTDKRIDTLLAAMDTNGDQHVSYEEFVDWLFGAGRKRETDALFGTLGLYRDAKGHLQGS